MNFFKENVNAEERATYGGINFMCIAYHKTWKIGLDLNNLFRIKHVILPSVDMEYIEQNRYRYLVNRQ